MMLSNGNLYNKREGEIIDGISSPAVMVLTLASAETAGGVASILNPFEKDMIITDVIIDVTTAATAAATIDVGIAADGETSNDSLIDGLDVNAAVGVFDNRIDKGTNGGMAKIDSDEYITISKASGSVAGLEGIAYIHGIPVQS